ncbi:hypothetical protein [Sphingopyxis sp.]|uniref:hypothetical protein n=1 Tax=Sphingopyxis sp. TaxID=1908224 RepID=UPI0025F2C6D6|nr:hypothetical protein [Sphingopyxis sp.]MBK6414058.1 hypothetical protein [Sphingopyxis sp.]
MSLLGLLLSRRAAAAGVGTGTRENKVLPPPALTPEIPERPGRGVPRLRRPRTIIECEIEDMLSPLTEGSYAARTYHTEERIWSHNGLYSIPKKAIKSITVTSGDGKTRRMCFSDRTTAAARVAETDIVEASRTWTTSNHAQRVNINGTFFLFAFDQRLDGIGFGGKCGRPFTISFFPTGGSASIHGSVFGAHVLNVAQFTANRLMTLLCKTDDTLAKFQISLASPGKLFEEFEETIWARLNTTTTPAPHAPFPWQRRIKAFGGTKGFLRVDGALFTDETLATRIDTVTHLGAGNSTTVLPRYFKFTTNADYPAVGTEKIIPGDAIINMNNIPFPEGTYTTAFNNSSSLLKYEHLFKTAAGEVWKIYVQFTAGTGSTLTDSYRVYLGTRFDRALDPITAVNRLLLTIDATNYSRYPDNPGAAPSKRPLDRQVVSSPDGTEAHILGYWHDVSISPEGNRPRTLTSVIHLAFSETGVADPLTGVGISVTHDEVPAVTGLPESDPDWGGVTPGTVSESTVDEVIGTYGAQTLYRSTYTKIITSDIFNDSTNSYRYVWTKILWVFPRHSGEWDFLTEEYSGIVERTRGGRDTSGRLEVVGTDQVDDGVVRRHQEWEWEGRNYLWYAEEGAFSVSIVSSVSGELAKSGFSYTQTSARNIAEAGTDSTIDALWHGPGAVTGANTSTINGQIFGGPSWSGSTTDASGSVVHTGTFYSTDFSAGPALAGGATEWKTSLNMSRKIDEENTETGLYFYPSDKCVRGQVVPYDTPNARVCVNPRTDTAHIAADDVSAGSFF